MRKNEIKPGVIYAYQRSRGDYEKPVPIVFLTAPADGKLYRAADQFKRSEDPAYIRTSSASKPGRGGGFGGRDVGYAAIAASWNSHVSPQDLLKPTQDDFAKTTHTGTGIDGARFMLVTSLAAITGPYDEEIAAYNARRDAERRQRDRSQAEREATHNRAASASAGLARFGVSVSPDLTNRGYLKLTVEDAEKLLAALNAAQG